MSNWYFTSDWHLDHERSLRFPARTSFSTHKELENIILNNTFEVLKPNDNIYYIGDLRWNSNKEWLDTFFSSFKKKRINFHWILGNHDKVPEGYHHSALVSLAYIKDVIVQKQPITLCHYPMLVWNKSHYNSWQLHGHIHLKDSTYNKWLKLDMNGDIPSGKRFNVNVEFHDWKPWSFDELKVEMDKLYDNWDLIKKADK